MYKLTLQVSSANLLWAEWIPWLCHITKMHYLSKRFMRKNRSDTSTDIQASSDKSVLTSTKTTTAEEICVKIVVWGENELNDFVWRMQTWGVCDLPTALQVWAERPSLGAVRRQERDGGVHGKDTSALLSCLVPGVPDYNEILKKEWKRGVRMLSVRRETERHSGDKPW